jgi:hypothetical protein
MFRIYPSGCDAGRQHLAGSAELACLQKADDQSLIDGEAVNAPLLRLDCQQAGDGFRKLAAQQVQQACVTLRKVGVGIDMLRKKAALLDGAPRLLPLCRAESTAELLPAEQPVIRVLQIQRGVLRHGALSDFEELKGFLICILFQAQLRDGGGDRTSGTRERPGGLPLMKDVTASLCLAWAVKAWTSK